MDYSIFSNPPTGFNPAVEVAGFYGSFQNTFLLLRRDPHKPQGNTWGVPAGKLEKGESPSEGLIREVYEEIGLRLYIHEIENFGTLFIRLPHIDYIYHMYYQRLYSKPQVVLSDEHTEAKWVTFQEAQELPLITGAKEALEKYKKFIDNFSL